MAARDLPGMYWDEEKKRYFPLSSRPAGSSRSPFIGKATSPLKSAQRARKRKRQWRTGNRSESPELEDLDRHSSRLDRRTDTWHALSSFRQSYPGSKSRRQLE